MNNAVSQLTLDSFFFSNSSKKLHLSVILYLFLTCVAALYFLFSPFPYVAVVVPLVIPGLLFVLNYPKFLYFLIVLMVPMDAWRSIPGMQVLSISKFAGIIIGVQVLVLILFDNKKMNRFKSMQWIPVILFLIIWIVATLFSQTMVRSLDSMRLLFQALIFTFLTAYFACERKFLQQMSTVLVAGTTFASFVGIAGTVLGISSLVVSQPAGGKEIDRIVGTSNDPNFFAAGVLFCLPIIAYFFAHSKKWQIKVVMVILYMINSIAIFLTYSRAVFLVWALLQIALIFELRKNFKMSHTGFYLLIAGALIFPVVHIIPKTQIYQRISTLKSLHTDPSLSRRSTYLVVAADALKKRPLLGWGPGSFATLFSQSPFSSSFASSFAGGGRERNVKLTYFRQPHNTYIDVIIGSGILGMTAFFFLIGSTVFSLNKQSRKWHNEGGVEKPFFRYLIYSLLAIMISLFTLSNLYYKYIWLVIGIVAGTSFQKKEETFKQVGNRNI